MNFSISEGPEKPQPDNNHEARQLDHIVGRLDILPRTKKPLKSLQQLQ
tara:strand:+ start:192 stop:335 length:144 start_codon:yes stop_codon:yes gene_type:complete